MLICTWLAPVPAASGKQKRSPMALIIEVHVYSGSSSPTHSLHSNLLPLPLACPGTGSADPWQHHSLQEVSSPSRNTVGYASFLHTYTCKYIYCYHPLLFSLPACPSQWTAGNGWGQCKGPDPSIAGESGHCFWYSRTTGRPHLHWQAGSFRGMVLPVFEEVELPVFEEVVFSFRFASLYWMRQ